MAVILSGNKDLAMVRLFNGVDSEQFKTIEVIYQKIPFEHFESCHVLELRDISHLHKLQE